MKHSFIVLLLIATYTISAQEVTNLVYNASFEEKSFCPQRIDALGVMKAVEAWWQPTRGSSDYFNLCGGRECTVPRNKMGTQAPHSGNAYCGIYCSQEDYREYLQTELRTPLQAGRRYRVAYFASLADKSPHAVAALGALLTADRIADSTMGILMHREIIDMKQGERQSIATYITPQVKNSADSVVDDTRGWTEICDTIVAEGGERFLTIGNFTDFNHSTAIDLHNALAVLQGAYYYIDDVSVVCLDTDNIEPAPAPIPPTEGEIVPMWGVYFDVDSHELLQQSYNELRRLLELLEAFPEMRIELRGHTDNTGTRNHNQQLSDDRAKSVADYLAEHGVERRRMTSIGFGGTLPVDNNDTPEGRARNRRVEYRVVGY